LLTVIIPTYNEAQNLASLTHQLFSLPISGLNLLFVDDNSPDGTGAIADQLAVEHPGRLSVLHRAGKLGLGTAYLQGFRVALDQGVEAIAQMDADFSHPPELLVAMMAALQTCDVVFGSRYVSGGAVDQDWSGWRKALSAFGNAYGRILLGMPVRDVTGGYRLWRRSALQGLPFEQILSNGYAFQVEIAYIAHRLGFAIKEIPFYFADRSHGQSKMSFRIQLEAALRVWQMRYRYRDIHPIGPRWISDSSENL
jgi:dolichol-phosphate mannosyltransferase